MERIWDLLQEGVDEVEARAEDISVDRAARVFCTVKGGELDDGDGEREAEGVEGIDEEGIGADMVRFKDDGGGWTAPCCLCGCV